MFDLVLDLTASPVAALGHLSYLLLVVSMAMRRMLWLRLLVIASALVGAIYSALILDLISAFWGMLLIAVNLVQLAITGWREMWARLEADELAFMARWLPGLSRGRARTLFDLGEWTARPTGAVLCEEGRPAPALYYLAHGAAEVRAGGRVVGHCPAGSLIGELTVAAGDPASGTVRLTRPSRLWRIEAPALRRVLATRPEIARSLEAGFFHAVRDKLVQSNRRAGEDRMAS